MRNGIKPREKETAFPPSFITIKYRSDFATIARDARNWHAAFEARITSNPLYIDLSLPEKGVVN